GGLSMKQRFILETLRCVRIMNGRIMRIFTFGILAALAVLLCSCNRADTGGTTAVVVDLDAVARAMGRDRVIDRRVEQATQALNAKLLEAAASMEKELKKQQADI